MHHDTTVPFDDTSLPLSDLLRDLARAVAERPMRLRDFLALAGEQGLLLVCLALALPFMLPFPIPGFASIVGLVGAFVAVGVVLNRVPWMPERLLNLSLPGERLAPTLERGAGLVRRLERVSHPRLLALTGDGAANRLNGLGLLAGFVLLLFPVAVLPFTNALPGWGVLFLTGGMLQRDGLFILFGYFLLLLTVIYFSAVAVFAVITGESVLQFLS